MFVQDIENEFYKYLIGKRILIIVNYDVDAVCATKILTTLFQKEHIFYSVIPIMGLAGMQRAFSSNNEDVKCVILINCGGCVDIQEELHPDANIKFFICDNHRPLDVCNIYSDSQICILSDASLEESVPPFDVIFYQSDEEEESEEDEVENEEGNAHKRQSRAEKFMKRMEMRKKRDHLMFEYTQYSFYGRSSAVIFFELAAKLRKDSIDQLWWAIVGITEQLLMGKIESSTYTLEINSIQNHVMRFSNLTEDQKSDIVAPQIHFENDLHLPLFRHWTVQDSMRYSMYCACKLRLWTLSGEKKLNQFLVGIGLPKAQAAQTFSSMDLVLREEFFQLIEKSSEKFGIPDIAYGSFTLKYGYRTRFSGSDYVYGIISTLESVKENKSLEKCFLEALDNLSIDNQHSLDKEIETIKKMLTCIFRQVQSSLESKQVSVTGPFLFYNLNEQSPSFIYPYSFIMLAKFILNGFVSTSRIRRAPNLPLVASCPIDVDKQISLVVGIPPISDSSTKNLFGKAFQHAAEKSNSTILQDFFETSLIQIKQPDLTSFLDALTVLLN